MSRFKILASVAVLVGASVAALSGRWPWQRLDVPAPAAVPTPVEPPPPAIHRTADTLRRGETVSHLFARHGVMDLDLARFREALSIDPRRLRAGLVFRFERPEADSMPALIQVRTSPEQRVVFWRAADGWAGEAVPIRWESEVLRFEGAIDNSLYEALDAQVRDDDLGPGDRVRLAWELADVFAWQIDFTRDIQPGDRFQVLLERLVSEDGEVRFGRILAGDLSVAGKQYTGFRFEGRDGETAFFDAEGNSLRRAFLRAPLEFRRISSNFSRARAHPVLGITRKHEGTDYAASSGTPVMAAGDGVVRRAGRAGGYGNLIELRHRNGITTRYGHLRGFARGIRAGVRVSQGQTIGYVGATGVATGPHLHYEFRVNGVAVDSRRVKLGNGAPVPAAERDAFERERARLSELLYRATPQMVALGTN